MPFLTCLCGLCESEKMSASSGIAPIGGDTGAGLYKGSAWLCWLYIQHTTGRAKRAKMLSASVSIDFSAPAAGPLLVPSNYLRYSRPQHLHSFHWMLGLDGQQQRTHLLHDCQWHLLQAWRNCFLLVVDLHCCLVCGSIYCLVCACAQICCRQCVSSCFLRRLRRRSGGLREALVHRCVGGPTLSTTTGATQSLHPIFRRLRRASLSHCPHTWLCPGIFT